MHGPPPKPGGPTKRGKHAGPRTLSNGPHVVAVRRLPKNENGKWMPQVAAWWKDLWASPMAPEYDDSDIHGLYLLASLIDDYWRYPAKRERLAAEIRQQRQCFGLTPLDRRRLQWEIDRGDSAAANTRRRREAVAPRPEPVGETDPRGLLVA